MVENVGCVIPPFEIELCPVRQEAEACLRKLPAPFAFQERVELGFEGVKMKHVGGGIVQLLWRKHSLPPVGGLLLLRNLHTQKLTAQILQAMPVREGTHELCGNFCAVDWAGVRT